MRTAVRDKSGRGEPLEQRGAQRCRGKWREGIRLLDGPAWNTVRNNTVTCNCGDSAVHLRVVAVGRQLQPHRENAATENYHGISVGWGAKDNSIRDNTALGSFWSICKTEPGL